MPPSEEEVVARVRELRVELASELGTDPSAKQILDRMTSGNKGNNKGDDGNSAQFAKVQLKDVKKANARLNKEAAAESDRQASVRVRTAANTTFD